MRASRMMRFDGAKEVAMKGNHTVDDNIKAKAAKWSGDSLHVEMLDGSVFVAPRRRLPELNALK